MAVKIRYFKPGTVSGVGAPHCAVTQTSPSPAATSGTGWTVSKVASGNYAIMDAGVERTTAGFGTTPLPSTGPDTTLGDCFFIPKNDTDIPWDGFFAAGDWTFTVSVIAVTSGSDVDGRVRVRLWRSPNANGSSATEITSGAVQGSIVTNLTTSTAQHSTGTISAVPQLLVMNEYLFFQVAWEITGAGGANGRDVLLRLDATNSKLTTPDYTDGYPFAATYSEADFSASANTFLEYGKLVSGFESAAAFGTPSINATLNASGFASTATFGTPTIDQAGAGNQNVSPDGFVSTATFGTPQLDATVSTAGFESAAAFGTPALDATLNASGFESAIVFGSPALGYAVDGFESVIAFGTPQLDATVSAVGFASTVVFGVPTLDVTASIAGFESTVVFGTPALDATVNASGFASTATFGAPVLDATLNASGFVSTVTFGTPALDATLNASGVESAVVFGAPQFTLSTDITGFESIVVFGTAQLDATVNPSGFESAVVFGDISIGYAVDGFEIPIAFGTPALDATVNASGFASAVVFGAPQLDVSTDISGFESIVVFGAPDVLAVINPDGISVSVLLGTPQLDASTDIPGLEVSIAFGSPLVGELLEVNPIGFEVLFAFGEFRDANSRIGEITTTVDISPDGLAVAVAMGEPVLDIGEVVAYPIGFASVASFGTVNRVNPPWVSLLMKEALAAIEERNA